MEDTLLQCLDMGAETGLAALDGIGLFGVFDGHNGTLCVQHKGAQCYTLVPLPLSVSRTKQIAPTALLLCAQAMELPGSSRRG